MIGSITVSLSPKREVVVRGIGGEALHGLVFNILKRTSVRLASDVHEQEGQKPLSISPLLDGCKLKDGYSLISSARKVTFKLTVLREDMLAVTASTLFLIMAEGGNLYLSRRPVTIESVDLCKESLTSFPKLLGDALPQLKLTLQFSTPTSFKTGTVQSLFPDPRLVFSSLLRRWNAFSETKLPEEYMKNFACIRVSNYDLHTELIHFSTYKMIGFKGRVEYELPEDSSEPFRRTANALANFALYAGVGVKTTMGMGQTRRIS